MADERLGRDLRKVETSVAPRPEFVEALYQRLVDERVTGPEQVQRVIPAARRRPSSPLLLVATLLVAGAVLGTVVVGGGATRPISNVPASSGLPLATTAATSAPPSASAARPAPASPPTLALASEPSGLSALAGDGRIVYERRQIGQPTRLRVLTSDASAVEFAPDVPGIQRAPAWAPDGEHVVFAAAPLDSPEAWRLWRSDPDGGSPAAISGDCELPDCLGESEPAYAPDGGRIAFVRTAPGTGGGPGASVLAVRDLATGAVTELASTSQPADRQLLHPSFSPDGSAIAFAIATRGVAIEEAASAIWSVRTDDTGLRRLTEDALVAGDPAWSPDGRRILFGTYPIRSIWQENQRALDISHLYTVAPDGSDLRRMPLPDEVGGASWVSGGNAILYTAIVSSGSLNPGYTWLMTVDADTTAIHAITRGASCCSWYAAQQPTP